MKNKRFTSFLTLFIVLIGLIFAPKKSTYATSSDLITDENKDLLEVELYTETKDIFPKDIFEEIFNEDDLEFLRKNYNAKINYLGNNVEIEIKTKMKPSTENGLILYADNKPIQVKSNGTIVVNKNIENISKIKASNNDHIHANSEINEYDLNSFNESKIKKISNSNKAEAIFTASSGNLLAVMDEKEENYLKKDGVSARRAHKGYGDKYYPGDWVHCNRFNGQLTDDVHYNWRTGSSAEKAKAVKNFYSSDCHVALVQAGSGCTSKGSCQCRTTQRAAYCSGFTKDKNSGKKCSYTYHKHSGLVVPR